MVREAMVLNIPPPPGADRGGGHPAGSHTPAGCLFAPFGTAGERGLAGGRPRGLTAKLLIGAALLGVGGQHRQDASSVSPTSSASLVFGFPAIPLAFLTRGSLRVAYETPSSGVMLRPASRCSTRSASPPSSCLRRPVDRSRVAVAWAAWSETGQTCSSPPDRLTRKHHSRPCTVQ
jgi:hypothetical protein